MGWDTVREAAVTVAQQYRDISTEVGANGQIQIAVAIHVPDGETGTVAAVSGVGDSFLESPPLPLRESSVQQHPNACRSFPDGDIDIIKVPGAYEIPLIARNLATKHKHHAVICLGAVIRGSTPHFDYVSAEVSKGVAAAGLETGVPIIFGVLTTDTLEQAIERAGSKSGNKGWDAAVAGIEMANLMDAVDKI